MQASSLMLPIAVQSLLSELDSSTPIGDPVSTVNCWGMAGDTVVQVRCIHTWMLEPGQGTGTITKKLAVSRGYSFAVSIPKDTSFGAHWISVDRR